MRLHFRVRQPKSTGIEFPNYASSRGFLFGGFVVKNNRPGESPYLVYFGESVQGQQKVLQQFLMNYHDGFVSLTFGALDALFKRFPFDEISIPLIATIGGYNEQELHDSIGSIIGEIINFSRTNLSAANRKITFVFLVFDNQNTGLLQKVQGVLAKK